jgi:4-hydroxy-4-methyl-2-oxoglutarate aldolase
MDEQQRRAVAVLKQFTVCQLLDAVGTSCPVETSISPIDLRYRICGPAFTVECIPGDNLTVHHALHLAKPGDVLIVGGSPNCEVALWGELMSVSAKSRGVAGSIVDGPVRDPMEIRALGYPVFCRRFHPCRAKKEMYGRINVPIQIGTLSINPRDVVVADANGIVSISPVRVQETIELASEVVQKENGIKSQILSGRTMFDIFDLNRYVTPEMRGT